MEEKICKNCVWLIRGRCSVSASAAYMMEHGFKKCKEVTDWPAVKPDHVCDNFKKVSTFDSQMPLL